MQCPSLATGTGHCKSSFFFLERTLKRLSFFQVYTKDQSHLHLNPPVSYKLKYLYNYTQPKKKKEPTVHFYPDT